MLLVDAKTDVLLKTVACIISNSRETKSFKVKVLLDPGSKKKSDTVRGFFQLDSINKQNILIKAFGDTKGQIKELGVFEFDLRDWNGNGLRIYLSGFSIPVVSGSVNEQKVKFMKSNYPDLKNLKLAGESLHKRNIDLLIGADFH